MAHIIDARVKAESTVDDAAHKIEGERVFTGSAISLASKPSICIRMEPVTYCSSILSRLLILANKRPVAFIGGNAAQGFEVPVLPRSVCNVLDTSMYSISFWGAS